MAVSFYKMFGYPTGVGALIIRKTFAEWLSGDGESGRDEATNQNSGKKVWFAGGTIDVVQVPGKMYMLSSELHERFEVSDLFSLLSASELI